MVEERNKMNEYYDTWDEEIRQIKEYWDAKGECLGYDGTQCPKCKRVRVEKYSKGERICEKCNWNKTLQKYEASMI